MARRRGEGASEVEGNLFGGPAATSLKAKRSDLPVNAVVVSRSELNRMKAGSILRTEEDVRREQEDREAIQAEKQKAARSRKERMLKLEAEAKQKAKKSDMEIMKIARDKTIRELAEKQVDENLDLVKMLNTLGARAAAFTIRDKQLEEKASREHIEKDYNQRMDMLMEVDRLKDLQERERVEEERLAKRLVDREVIVQQMKEAERQKMLAEEAREQENQAMIALVKRYQEEDRVAAEKRMKEVARSRAEVVAANEDAIRRKERAKEMQREEEEAILMYQAKKDEDMARREAEEEAKANAVKERQKKLLAQQEKSQNKQAEIDELRARRYAEEKERREREREKSEAADRKKRIKELSAARTEQAAQRKAMMAREAVMQQQEYEESSRHSMAIMERESKEAAERKLAASQHRDALQAQINDIEFNRKYNRNDKYDEGKKLKEEFAAERAKLETIRDKMVEDMTKKGVNPKYLTEMMNTDIGKMQMR